ncbi:hypothetical protein KGP36_01840 [Patescibacteria group bacterium]|nr:hypothetical protein [Patescibacteria group bacterium]
MTQPEPTQSEHPVSLDELDRIRCAENAYRFAGNIRMANALKLYGDKIEKELNDKIFKILDL